MTAPSDTCRKDTRLTTEQCVILGSTRVREEGITGRGEHRDENFVATIRESLRAGAIGILELGKIIEAPIGKHGGLETEFGVIALERRQTICLGER